MDLDALKAQANDAYVDEDYELARDLFTKVVNQYMVSDDLAGHGTLD